MDFMQQVYIGQLPDWAGERRIAIAAADQKRPIGTHEHKLDADARARRKAKAARTASRHGNATRPREATYRKGAKG